MSGVNFGVQFGPREVLFIVFQQQFAGFFVQGRLGIGHYEQAFDCEQDVLDAELRFPVFFERVDANLAIGRYIRMLDWEKQRGFLTFLFPTTE